MLLMHLYTAWPKVLDQHLPGTGLLLCQCSRPHTAHQVTQERMTQLHGLTVCASNPPPRHPPAAVFHVHTGHPPPAAKRALRRHDVLLNGQRGVTTSTVTSGDTVQLLTRLGGGKQWADTSNKPHLPLAYEDQHMAIVIKPQGLSTQGKGETSVQGRIKYCLQPTPLPGALYRPHHVRLTSACSKATRAWQYFLAVLMLIVGTVDCRASRVCRH